MQINKETAIEKYKNLSGDELKSTYQELINSKFCYATKEDQMRHDVEASVYAKNNLSFNLNTGTFQMSDPQNVILASQLVELIKTKTGENLNAEKKEFFYSIAELIDFLVPESKYSFWNKEIKSFFDNLDNKKLDYLTTDSIIKVIRDTLKDRPEDEINEMIKRYGQLYKIQLMLRLANISNKPLFQDFCKEIATTKSINDTFLKYNTLTTRRTFEGSLDNH